MAGRTAAALVALPVVLAAAVLVALETARAVSPRWDLFARPAAVSLIDALDRDDLVQARALLVREPGLLLWVNHPDLTAGTSTLVSPLLWAAATGNDDGVRMLLGLGHDMSRGADRHAACLARAAGKPETAKLLLAYGNPPEEPCPPLDGSQPPLLALLRPVR